MGRSLNLLIFTILRIWIADTQIFVFAWFWKFYIGRIYKFWISIILRIWHLQNPRWILRNVRKSMANFLVIFCLFKFKRMDDHYLQALDNFYIVWKNIFVGRYIYRTKRTLLFYSGTCNYCYGLLSQSLVYL